MIEADLFAEDRAQEDFVSVIAERIAREFGLTLSIHAISVAGGHGRVVAELSRYLNDVEQASRRRPDLLIVAIDSNCRGLVDCMREVEDLVRGHTRIPEGTVALALPDPHIERWLLVDSAAFKQVVGVGCQAPDHKCGKDRYKEMLAQCVTDAGVNPVFYGTEYAEDLARQVDIDRAVTRDSAFQLLCDRLRDAFRLIERLESSCCGRNTNGHYR